MNKEQRKLVKVLKEINVMSATLEEASIHYEDLDWYQDLKDNLKKATNSINAMFNEVK